MAWRYNEARIEAAKAARMEDSIRSMDAAPLSEGECYFFGSREAGIVKIGFSTSLVQRLNRLRSGSLFWKMTLLATARGGRSREVHYHRLFRDHAMGGEWFYLRPDILEEIDRLNAAAPRQGRDGLTTRMEVRHG